MGNKLFRQSQEPQSKYLFRLLLSLQLRSSVEKGLKRYDRYIEELLFVSDTTSI